MATLEYDVIVQRNLLLSSRHELARIEPKIELVIERQRQGCQLKFY